MSFARIDVLIAGGGVGGVAAAQALLEAGYRVLMTEETDWLGGQLSSQAVPSDEHPWIERHGATRRYLEFRQKVRSYYQRNYPLSKSAAEALFLNPGNAGVSPISHEPRVSQLVIEEILSPYLASGQLTLMKEAVVVELQRQGGVIREAVIRRLQDGRLVSVKPAYVLDATEMGELLPLAGEDFVTGNEGGLATGEPHAPTPEPDPLNMQAITWVAALGYDPACPEASDRYRIERPRLYDFWKGYRPPVTPPWPGSLLSWRYTSPFTLEPIERSLFPGFWSYRRVIAAANFSDPESWMESSILNWPQNDYFEHEVVCCTPEEREVRYERARQLTLSFVYWLQNEAPREDGGEGYAGIHLRPDVTGTVDGLAKAPYIREARRLCARKIVSELEVGVKASLELLGRNHAERFADSVGIGYYRIDLHPSTGGDNYIDIESFPFQIPLGALLGHRCTNLIAAGKNIGTTHISNGCYRLHPVEWNIGEAAGLLAAYCLRERREAWQVHATPGLLADFQRELGNAGISLEWPQEVCEAHRAGLSAHFRAACDAAREEKLKTLH